MSDEVVYWVAVLGVGLVVFGVLGVVGQWLLDKIEGRR